MAIVSENDRLPIYYKRTLYFTYTTILFATLAEFGSVALNGAPMNTVFLHKVVKSLDYILSPITAVFMVRQLYPEKKAVGPILYAFIANTLLSVISIFTGWTFYIDSANYYQHGPWFPVYIAFYLLCILYGMIKFFSYGTRFRNRNRMSLLMIIALLISGILVQEIVSSNIRTCSLTLAIVSVLLLLHTMEFSQMQKDDDLEMKQKQLDTDPLTGLLSRFAYSTELERLESTERLPDRLAVFSIDVNRLKNVNDTLGHAAGDELIRGAAECMKRALGEYGKVYRTGGDEFIALIYADAEQLISAAKALRRETAAWHGTLVSGLSVSFGSVLADEFPDMKLEKLITVADVRMYEDKNRFYIESGLDRRKH